MLNTQYYSSLFKSLKVATCFYKIILTKYLIPTVLHLKGALSKKSLSLRRSVMNVKMLIKMAYIMIPLFSIEIIKTGFFFTLGCWIVNTFCERWGSFKRKMVSGKSLSRI